METILNFYRYITCCLHFHIDTNSIRKSTASFLRRCRGLVLIVFCEINFSWYSGVLCHQTPSPHGMIWLTKFWWNISHQQRMQSWRMRSHLSINLKMKACMMHEKDSRSYSGDALIMVFLIAYNWKLSTMGWTQALGALLSNSYNEAYEILERITINGHQLDKPQWEEQQENTMWMHWQH